MISATRDMQSGLNILFEDDGCVVLNKPGGLLTQAPIGIDSLEFRLKRFLKERNALGSEVYLGVPHRLDRPASGAIVFAKTLKAAQKLSLQFERRFVKKTYWALAMGSVEPGEGVWTDHLKKIEGEPRTIIADSSDHEARVAVLRYRVMQRLDRRTLIEIELETGRTHQIRVQCAVRGHPVVGDSLYGSNELFGPWSDDERERLVALHARTLGFRNPITRQDMMFEAPLPSYWSDADIEGA